MSGAIVTQLGALADTTPDALARAVLRILAAAGFVRANRKLVVLAIDDAGLATAWRIAVGTITLAERDAPHTIVGIYNRGAQHADLVEDIIARQSELRVLQPQSTPRGRPRHAARGQPASPPATSAATTPAGTVRRTRVAGGPTCDRLSSA